jgi:exopolyphosphatase/guanosine-5'-triphosphate,3'-diphosphate pyrophosphatase
MLASIDIGTNSILLLIAEEKDGELVPVYQEARIARLGEGASETALLSDDAQKRAETILTDYAHICREHGVTNTYACGTAALRSAANAQAFVDHIRTTLGLAIDIISEEREALLSFRANAASFGNDIVVMDIGGGSTEFIAQCPPDQWRAPSLQPLSLTLGVVSLTETHLLNDPPLEGEIESLRGHIKAFLKGELDDSYYNDGTRKLVASAGTPTTLAALRDEVDPYDPARVHGTTLALTEIDDLITLLEPLTNKERSVLPGLQKGREDVILAGAVLLREACALLGYDDVLVSDRGVRWGLLYEKIQG